MLLKSTLVALALAGTAFIGCNAAEARDYHRSPAVTIGFGDVAIGYRDGYMDNNHSYHRWHRRNDYVSYRSQHRDQYHNWNHDRR
jgi:hypothetical protein